MRDLKVGDSDGAGPALAVELLERVPGRDEVTAVQGRQWPVDQEQVNIVRTECLESAIEGSARIIGPMKAVVELAGDVNLTAIQPGSPDRLPHFLFVAIHLRGVDVPIADTQRLTDRGGSLSRDDLEDSEAELRDRIARC